jgi:hypothetical protein
LIPFKKSNGKYILNRKDIELLAMKMKDVADEFASFVITTTPAPAYSEFLIEKIACIINLYNDGIFLLNLH